MKTLKPTIKVFRVFQKSKQTQFSSFSGIAVLLFFISSLAFSQKDKTHLLLGSEEVFTQNVITSTEINATITLDLPDGQAVSGIVNVKKITADGYDIIGSIGNSTSATFRITKNGNIIEGNIILFDQKKAYRYYSEPKGEVFIKEIDINEIVCIGYKVGDIAKKIKEKPAAKIPNLQSLPGAIGTIYLDFDGEAVSETDWNGGRTVTAAPSGFSEERIIEAWRMVAEDFRVFNINVTTDRAVFDAAPKNRRQMCIFTPETDGQPRAEGGGIAQFNSFSDNRDNPCWAFYQGKYAGRVGSHELGHTFGLDHDGTTEGVEYYQGHGEWGPIMGGLHKSICQWGKGEYEKSNNTEDDLAIIAGNRNGVGFLADEYGDTISKASTLNFSSDGTVSAEQNTGLITTPGDKDVFSFTTSGGEVIFNIKADPYDPNLNVQARLLNIDGDELSISNPFKNLNASITMTLDPGTFFLEIDGVGEGENPSVGYSDYGSIGIYSISGSIPTNTLAINDYLLDSELLIYPNPTSGIIHINGLPNREEEHEIIIANIIGQIAMKSNTSAIDMSALEDGLYFINIDNKVTKRVIKISRL